MSAPCFYELLTMLCSLQRLSGGICPCWQRSRPGELRRDYQEDQGNNEWQEDGVKEGNSCHRFFGAMSRGSGAKNMPPKDFLHPRNEFVLLTTPQCPLQASCQDACNGLSLCDARCKWLVSVTNTALLNRLYLYRRCLLPAPESCTLPQPSQGPQSTSLRWANLVIKMRPRL